jgi:hypothetical protein
MNLIRKLLTLNEKKSKELIQYIIDLSYDAGYILNSLDEFGQLGYILRWLYEKENIGVIVSRTTFIAYISNIERNYEMMQKVIEQGNYIFMIEELPEDINDPLAGYVWGIEELFKTLETPF